MYNKRLKIFRVALENYKEKEKYKYAKDAISFSYSSEEGVEPWNSWSVLPWEMDPYKYRTLRYSVATLLRLIRKRVISQSSFMYFLYNLERQFECQNFPFWHSNELPNTHPFGGEIRVMLYGPDTPCQFAYMPFVYFFLLRFFLLNFYRFRKIPSKGNLPWGALFSFVRVPSYMWKLAQHPGLLQVVWDIPGKFIDRWNLSEDEFWVTGNKYRNERMRWFKAQKGIWQRLWSPEKDADTHSQFLRRLKTLKIAKTSHPGSKRFFLDFFLAMKHTHYEYFAVDLPKLFKLRTYLGVNYLRRVLYVTKEGDLIRFYIYMLYDSMQYDIDHVDRMLNFVFMA